MATDAYYIEKYFAPILAIILGTINYIFPSLLFCENPKEFISKTTDISFIVFGFMVTILTILFQVNEVFRKRQLYPRLIGFNKRVVFLALSVGIISMIFLSVFSFAIHSSFKEIFISLYLVLLVWLVLDVIYFLKIFYKLILHRDI